MYRVVQDQVNDHRLGVQSVSNYFEMGGTNSLAKSRTDRPCQIYLVMYFSIIYF